MAKAAPSPEALTAYEDDAAQVKYAQKQIDKINKALDAREQFTVVFNGIPYSQAYEYNMKKGINYAPKAGKEDREVSFGIPHEKILSFCSIFLKYVFTLRVRCYSKDMLPIKGMGEVYRLAIEYSRLVENFKKLLAYIYYETFTQGNAFVLEDWEVRTFTDMEAYKGDTKLKGDDVDFTYEFLDNTKFKEGEKIQTRRAVSRVLDGRQVIFDNPEIEQVEDQPGITLEEELDRDEAEKLYGSLKRWKSVPETAAQITSLSGLKDKQTLFNSNRWSDAKNKVIVHRRWEKPTNRFNIYLNGVMMFDKDTPFTFFYPGNMYPITNVPAERLKGSIYARSVPAKTKFNSDYIDWLLKKMAVKLEQGIDPAIITRGKYTLTRDMFKAGQVTHGVRKEDYDLANPDNKGITQPEFSFISMMKEIIETQTLNPSASGEITDATATAISLADAGQRDKLAYLLDGLIGAHMDMAYQRLETIKYKYTQKQRETFVDGKPVSVYQNFTVNLNGTEHNVVFNDAMPTDPTEVQDLQYKLFEQAHQSKKDGAPMEFHIADPLKVRDPEITHIIEVVPERIKDSNLMMISLFDEFGKLLEVFGPEVNREQLKKMYTDATGRPSELFNPPQPQQQPMPEDGAGQMDTGSMGKNNIKGALKNQVLGQA
jgi:hypothetical protein